MKKITALCLALLLCLGVMPTAFAATEYPPRPTGTVSDLAGVLGEETIADWETLSQRLSDVTGGKMYVLTRHFLGGMDAQEYANKVFDVWDLASSDTLLLMVIGEESYALSLGSRAKAAVPADTQTSFLASHFRGDYLGRRYDEALADLGMTLGQALAKGDNKTLSVSGLFGQAAIASTPKPTVSDYWYGMFAQEDYDTQEADDNQAWQHWQDEWRYEETRINWRSVIIWGLVIYFLFFRRKRSGKRR